MKILLGVKQPYSARGRANEFGMTQGGSYQVEMAVGFTPHHPAFALQSAVPAFAYYCSSVVLNVTTLKVGNGRKLPEFPTKEGVFPVQHSGLVTPPKKAGLLKATLICDVTNSLQIHWPAQGLQIVPYPVEMLTANPWDYLAGTHNLLEVFGLKDVSDLFSRYGQLSMAS